MKQFLLAVALIVVPVSVFSVGLWWVGGPPTAAVQGLGDMTPFAAIVADVQTFVAKGDLAGAAGRITDLETAWDDAEATLRAQNAGQWGTVDNAIDAALTTLRAATQVPGEVTASLADLQKVLADPAAATGQAGQGQVVMVGSVAVTDALGHPIPCEEMLEQLRTALAAATLSAADQAKALELQAKATERCNADDDTRSDAFSAEALSLAAP